MIIINIGLPKTMTTMLHRYINNYTDITTIFSGEFTVQTALEYDYNKLKKDKNYYMKNPTMIINQVELTKIIQKIKKSGHQVKLILGIRDMLNQIISLCNHWNNAKHARHLLYEGEEHIHYKEIYNKIMVKFYTNIDSKIKFLKNYDSVIYNLEHCNMTLSNFLNQLFKSLAIKVNININIPDINMNISNYSISHHEDIKNLKENIDNFNLIEEQFNKVFKNISICHIRQF